MLAALAATPTAADYDVIKGCVVEHHEMFGHMWTCVVVILLTFGCVRAYVWVSGLVRGQRSRNVASQTPTTYTQVRGAARPCFSVLAEHAHC